MRDLHKKIQSIIQNAINIPPDHYDGYLAYDTTDELLAAASINGMMARSDGLKVRIPPDSKLNYVRKESG